MNPFISKECIYRYVLTIFALLFFANVYSQTYRLNVGERYTLPSPTPPAGCTANATNWSTDRSDCIGVAASTIFVHHYFSGSAKVECYYTFLNPTTKVKTNGTITYTIVCEKTKIILNKSAITLEAGEEYQLSYTTDPYGLEPIVEWSSSDKNVAVLDYYTKGLVYAVGGGTCTIKVEGNTGYDAPTCKVTVVDNRWVKADVESGAIKKGTKVTLTSSKSGATIYYTTDGSEPSKSSSKYTSPIEINSSMTLKAKAYVGNEESKISQWKYTVTNHLDGEYFKVKSIEGVEVSYKTTAYATGKIFCSVASVLTSSPAIDKNYSGHLTIPEFADGIRVEKIDKNAFYNCALTSISLPENTSSIPRTFTIKESAFKYSDITSITFPVKMVAEIEKEAFSYCTSLETINFNHWRIKSIGSKAFDGCVNIKTINSSVDYDLPRLLADAFPDKVYSNATLYIPEGARATYILQKWNKFKNIVEVGDQQQLQKITLGASPSGGDVESGTTITLATDVSGADIYYTLNGSTPSNSSNKYTSAGITINESCTLKAIAYKDGYETSDVLTANYTIKKDSQTEPTSISVSPSSKTIKVGDTFTVSYTLSPSNASTTVTWSSDDTSIATVSSSGTVTGKKAGSTYINATTSNGKTAYCKVTVESSSTGKDIAINSTNFPDANFRNYLLEQDYGKDGVITEEEISKVTHIYVSKKEIKNLKEIEYFTALTYLDCQSNQLTTLDISKNTALKYLYCGDNQLTLLDVTKNFALTCLGCGRNQLTFLDVSKNTFLTNLNCNHNQLTSLDVSKNTALTDLECYDNQLTLLDVSKNTALTILYCWDNQLISLDVSKNTALTYLGCDNNQLTSLDISKNTALTSLSCDKNQLTSLDVSKNTALNQLYCDYNQLASLDVSKNTALTYLRCDDNQLTLLDVSKNTALTNLGCDNNQLTSLDVSKNTALTDLGCYSNQLTSLDVSKNTALTDLDCRFNQLTSLIVSKSNDLKNIYCYGNCIKSSAMDDLIKSLATNNTSDEHKIYIVSKYNEQNVCTTTQVDAIKAKGWKVYDANREEYLGSDPSGIEGILMDADENAPVYDLSGKLLSEPRKGINIIGGKKVLVK